jgi:DeoR/GlpR family transcriptional regulator of sugar metabolism
MLTTTRKALLLDRLARDGALAVSPLAVEFGLSEDTLRRDLRELAAEGKLVRVHGGAVAASPTHLPTTERKALHEPEKRRLATAAATLIADGATVIIDGGTTHLFLAAAVPLTRRFTLVTHSPAVAASFEHHQSVDIILIGGRIFRHSMVALGVETASAFRQVRADLCLLGATGLHAELGVTTGDAEEAQLKRVMVDSAAELVIAATSDKLGKASPWAIAPLTSVSTLITCAQRPDWLPDCVSHVHAD